MAAAPDSSSALPSSDDTPVISSAAVASTSETKDTSDDQKEQSDAATSSSASSGATEFHSELLLSDETILGLGVPKEAVQQFKQQKFREAFTLEKWVRIPALESLTFETAFVDLSPSEVRSLHAYLSFSLHKDTYASRRGTPITDAELKELLDSDVSVRHSCQKWFDKEAEHSARLDSVVKRIDDEISSHDGWLASGFFAKFNSRSPKDVFNYMGDDPEYRRHFWREMLDVMDEHGGRDGKERPRLANANDAILAWYRFGARLLRMENGRQVLDTLKHSYRAVEDVQACLRLKEDRFVTLSIALRKWEPAVPDQPYGEFRGFVHARKLNAVTQYMSMIYFPILGKAEVREKVESSICEFFETVKDDLPFDCCVLDFLVLGLKEWMENGNEPTIRIIEFNPFYSKAGSGLFSWKTDRELFLNGPCQFRFVDEALLEKDALNLLHASWVRAFEDFRSGKEFDDITPKKKKMKEDESDDTAAGTGGGGGCLLM